MSIELFTERIMAPALMIIGLSHVMQPAAWGRFFDRVRETGVAGFIIAMFTLPFGLLLIAGHNKWVWDWPVFLTICGWGFTVKSTLYLVFPALADRMIDKVAKRHPNGYLIAGVPMTLLGGWLTWLAYRNDFNW